MTQQTKAAANFLKGLAKQVREFRSAHGGPEAVSLRLAEDDGGGGDGAARVILRVQRLVTEGADAAVEAQVLVSITYNVRGALFAAPVVRFLTENNVFKVGPLRGHAAPSNPLLEARPAPPGYAGYRLGYSPAK